MILTALIMQKDHISGQACWLFPVTLQSLRQAAQISGPKFLCWNKHSHQLPVAADERFYMWVYVFSN